jgi:hypothetical protein
MRVWTRMSSGLLVLSVGAAAIAVAAGGHS